MSWNHVPGEYDIRIEMFRMLPVGGYKTYYHRPLTVNADHASLDMLSKTLESSLIPGTMTTTPEMYSPIANMISPSIIPTESATIAEGWDAPRLNYIMKVGVYPKSTTVGGLTVSGGHKQVYFIQGYSAYYDPSYGGKIDEKMPFFINNMVLANEIATPNGVKHVVLKSTNVLFNPDYMAFDMPERYSFKKNDYHTVRPEDVYTGMKLAEIAMDGTLVNDTNTSLTAMPKGVSRDILSPTVYLDEIVNAWVRARSLAEMSTDVNDITQAAKASVKSGSLVNNPFISALINMAGLDVAAFYTLEDLKEIDPNILNVAELVYDEQTQVTLPPVSDSEDWNVPTVEASLATQVSQILSSLMMRSMVTKLSFMATNDSGQDNIVITFAAHMIQSQISNQNTYIEAAIRRDIIPLLSFSGERLYMINVIADSFGTTFIDLSLNGQPPVRYTVPSFADNLISPLIVPSNNHLLAVSETMNAVVDTAVTAIESVNAYQPVGVTTI